MFVLFSAALCMEFTAIYSSLSFSEVTEEEEREGDAELRGSRYDASRRVRVLEFPRCCDTQLVHSHAWALAASPSLCRSLTS